MFLLSWFESCWENLATAQVTNWRAAATTNTTSKPNVKFACMAFKKIDMYLILKSVIQRSCGWNSDSFHLAISEGFQVYMGVLDCFAATTSFVEIDVELTSVLIHRRATEKLHVIRNLKHSWYNKRFHRIIRGAIQEYTRYRSLKAIVNLQL